MAKAEKDEDIVARAVNRALKKKAKQKKYYEDHKEEFSKKQKEYYRDHVEYYRDYNRDYRLKYKTKFRDYQRKRRAEKKFEHQLELPLSFAKEA